MSEEQIIMKNLRKCPHFDKCSQNLCPLDFEIESRTGGESDKCRWMRERKAGIRKFTDKFSVEHKFKSSGSPQMPDRLLKFVPEKNVKWLNEVSRKRWFELEKQ